MLGHHPIISGLTENNLVRQQGQREKCRRREKQRGELLHGIPPSTPLDSEGTARSIKNNLAR